MLAAEKPSFGSATTAAEFAHAYDELGDHPPGPDYFS